MNDEILQLSLCLSVSLLITLIVFVENKREDFEKIELFGFLLIAFISSIRIFPILGYFFHIVGYYVFIIDGILGMFILVLLVEFTDNFNKKTILLKILYIFLFIIFLPSLVFGLLVVENISYQEKILANEYIGDYSIKEQMIKESTINEFMNIYNNSPNDEAKVMLDEQIRGRSYDYDQSLLLTHYLSNHYDVPDNLNETMMNASFKSLLKNKVQQLKDVGILYQKCPDNNQIKNIKDINCIIALDGKAFWMLGEEIDNGTINSGFQITSENMISKFDSITYGILGHKQVTHAHTLERGTKTYDVTLIILIVDIQNNCVLGRESFFGKAPTSVKHTKPTFGKWSHSSTEGNPWPEFEDWLLINFDFEI